MGGADGTRPVPNRTQYRHAATVPLPRGARDIASVRQLTETIRRAEASGIDTLVIPDHLIPQLGPISAMAAISSIMVSGVDELAPVVERLAGT